MVLMNYGSGFRDEMVATAFVLVVTVTGSFFLLNKIQISEQTSTDGNKEVLGVSEASNEAIENHTETSKKNIVSSVSDNKPFVPPTVPPTPPPTPSPSPTPSTTPQPAVVEIPYGSSQEFENAEYIISFSNPRMIVGESRKFKVDVVLANKSVPNEGLSNALLATISRNNQVVATDVPMTLSDAKNVHIGEQLSFEASLSMIEQTDINTITFRHPDAQASSTYNLSPI